MLTRVVIGVLTATAAVAAQQPPVFRTRTDLVQIDVVVVDADGRAVRGLTAADFRVLDNQAKQTIAAFQEISHDPDLESALPPDAPSDVADNATNPDRLIVLVLDDLHFQAKTEGVKDMARRVVSDIGPRASLALVTTSGSFGIEPTDNRAALLAELDRFLDRYDPELKRLAPGARMPAPSRIVNAMGEGVTTRGPDNLGRFFGDMGTYVTVKNVVQRIAVDGLGRRNALVWISGGMNAPSMARCAGSMDPKDTQAHYCGELAGLVEALGKSNVTAYGVSTGDFAGQLLRDVAELSGGFVVSSRMFDRDLPRLIQDLDHYYLLGFQAENPKDTSLHDLRVEVTRPGLTVRHRRSYRSAGKAPAPKNKDPLAQLSEGVLPVTDLHLRLHATPLVAAKGRRPTLITLEAAAPRASLVEADRFLRDVLRYQVWAVDLNKKKAGRSVARQARLVLAPDEAEAFEGDPMPFQVRSVLDLAPGRYQLRASASSQKTGLSGSVFLNYVVDEVRKEQLALGQPILTYDDRQRVPIVRGGLADGLSTIAPTLDRRFFRTDVLRLLCDVSPGTGVTTQVTVDLKAAGAASSRRLSTTQVTSPVADRIDLPLPLADLEPGGYVLHLRATAGAQRVERQIAFVVLAPAGS